MSDRELLQSHHPRPSHWVGRVQSGLLLDSPVAPHPGSRCWVAVVWPDRRVPAGWASSALPPGPRGRGYVAAHSIVGLDGRPRAVALVSPGDVVEFGADYSRPRRWRRSPEMVPVRWCGIVVSTDPDALVLWGPYPDRDRAWDDAQQALARWRESHRVPVPGLTDVPSPPVPEPVEGQPALPGSVVEVRRVGETVRIDDPAHGTLLVSGAAFGAAMAMSPDALRELLVDAAPDLALGGDESHPTLAALAARHGADRLTTDPLADGVGPGAGPTYRGRPDGTVVHYRSGDERVLSPPRYWTPDGFGWGHDAETAWELSFALLADATGSPDTARRLAPRHATEVLAHLPARAPWSIGVDDVRAWAVDAARQAGLAPSWSTSTAAGSSAGAGL